MNKLVIANWKMQMNAASIENLTNEMAPIFNEYGQLNQIVLCPSYPYIAHLNGLKNISIGAQNCASFASGAYTGEVSAAMLAELGVKYVILGHCERRTNFGESSQIVAQKAKLAAQNNMVPVICVGESLMEYQKGISIDILHQKLSESIPQDLENAVIAYEPIWAIGTGLTPRAEEIESIAEKIKNFTSNKFRIIYGGSVNETLALDIAKLNNISGILIGGASTKINEFSGVIKNYCS